MKVQSNETPSISVDQETFLKAMEGLVAQISAQFSSLESLKKKHLISEKSYLDLKKQFDELTEIVNSHTLEVLDQKNQQNHSITEEKIAAQYQQIVNGMTKAKQEQEQIKKVQTLLSNSQSGLYKLLTDKKLPQLLAIYHKSSNNHLNKVDQDSKILQEAIADKASVIDHTLSESLKQIGQAMNESKEIRNYNQLSNTQIFIIVLSNVFAVVTYIAMKSYNNSQLNHGEKELNKIIENSGSVRELKEILPHLCKDDKIKTVLTEALKTVSKPSSANISR